MLFGIGDIRAMEIVTDSLVRIPRIDHHHIRVLLQQLSHYGVHVERLAAPAWSDTEEVGVVCIFHGSLFTRDVNGYGKPLPVGIIGCQGCLFRVLQMFLEEQAQGSVRERKEQVIVRVERIGIAGKGAHEQFQLVVGGPRRHDGTVVEFGLDER